MSKLPEAVIEAANDFGLLTPEARARRVILALAENLPESAVEKALDAWYPGEDWRGVFGKSDTAKHVRRDMRAAIVAALKDLGGE